VPSSLKRLTLVWSSMIEAWMVQTSTSGADCDQSLGVLCIQASLCKGVCVYKSRLSVWQLLCVKLLCVKCVCVEPLPGRQHLHVSEAVTMSPKLDFKSQAHRFHFAKVLFILEMSPFLIGNVFLARMPNKRTHLEICRSRIGNVVSVVSQQLWPARFHWHCFPDCHSGTSTEANLLLR